MNSEDSIRINRYLSEAGFCSRRQADALVKEGRVRINGEPAQIGTKITPGDLVEVDGNAISRNTSYKVYAFYKPRGYISSLSDEQGKGIASFTEGLGRVYPVGRLDKDSEGLLLLTNDGLLMNEILSAAGGHEKEYRVGVNRDITEEFLTGMAGGVPITNPNISRTIKSESDFSSDSHGPQRTKMHENKVITAPCKVFRLAEREFGIVLIQGLNRQIRRMCGYFSYEVTQLERIRIMNITVDGLKPGDIREITGEELEELQRLCRKSGK